MLIHGAGGGGTLAVQLAHDAGARVIATGRAHARAVAEELGAERGQVSGWAPWRRHDVERARFLYSLLMPQMLSATSKYVPDDPVRLRGGRA